MDRSSKVAAHGKKDAEDGQRICDDALIEIVSRLPPKPQTRFKSVSKTWHRLASNIILHSKPRSPISGFFIQANAPFMKPESICYLPLGDDESCTNPTFSFLPCRPSYRYKCIADSYGGFVLLTFFSTNRAQNEYVLCNPVTLQWLSLPPPPTRISRNGTSNKLRVHSSLVLDDPTLVSSREYKVIRFCSGPAIDMGASGGDDEHAVDICVDIYSSRTRQWAQSKASMKNRPDFYLLDVPPVLFDGAIYLSSAPQQVLRFDIEEESCQLLRLPDELARSWFMENPRGFGKSLSCLGVCEGRLCYAYHNCSEMEVWMLGDSRSGSWVLKHAADLEVFGFVDWPYVDLDDLQDILRNPFDILGFHPTLDAVFIRKQDGFQWYDFRKGELETIMSDFFSKNDDREFLAYPFLECYISLGH